VKWPADYQQIRQESERAFKRQFPLFSASFRGYPAAKLGHYGKVHSKNCCPPQAALPIFIQSVYSFEIIVPVVQRTEQGFPNPADFPSHEGSEAN